MLTAIDVSPANKLETRLMSTARYPMPEEIRVSRSEAIKMLCDPSLIVLAAIPEDSDDVLSVSYWPDSKGQLPPWIVPSKAA